MYPSCLYARYLEACGLEPAEADMAAWHRADLEMTTEGDVVWSQDTLSKMYSTAHNLRIALFSGLETGLMRFRLEDSILLLSLLMRLAKDIEASRPPPGYTRKDDRRLTANVLSSVALASIRLGHVDSFTLVVDTGVRSGGLPLSWTNKVLEFAENLELGEAGEKHLELLVEALEAKSEV